MKPLFLRLQAFGPFAEQETVRFTELGENPLFLINGPTGAGKTSLLDGISYALYGETTGDRSAEQMRCDHAAADTETQVCFIFQLADKVYKIERSPTQTVAKLRGEGTTERRATGSIWALTEEANEPLEQWPQKLLVDKKIRELDSYVQGLIGLDAEQFRQVVVLPQGKFRELLTANSTQREEIFASLFQTQRYQWIETAFREKARALQREYSRVKEDMNTIFAEAGVVAVDTDEAGQAVSKEAQLAERLAASAAPLSAAEALYQQQAKHVISATRALENGQALANNMQRLQQLVAEQQQLASEQDSIQALQQRLRQAKAAAVLQPEWQQLGHLQAEKKQAEVAVEQAQKVFQAAQLEQQQSERNYTAAVAAAKVVPDLQAQLAPLQNALRAAQKLTTAQTDQADLAQKAKAAHQQVAALQQTYSASETRYQALQQAMEATEQALGQHQDTAPQLAVLAQQIQLHQQRVAQQRQLQQLQQAQQQLEQLIVEREENVARVVAAEKHTMRGWHVSQALLLSRELAAGEPCMVCGSLEHPQPAHTCHSKQSVVEQAAVDAAQQATLAARDALHQAQSEGQSGRERIAYIQQRINELTQQLGTAASLSAAALTEQQQALQALASQQQQQQQLYQQQQSQWRGLSNALQQQQQELQAARSELQRAEQAVQSNRERLAELTAELPPNLQDATAIEQQLGNLQEQIERLNIATEQLRVQREQANQSFTAAQTSLAFQQQNLADSSTKLQAAEANWQQKLHASEFIDVETFQQAMLTAEQEQDYSARVQAWQQAVQRNQTLREEVEQSVAGQTPPELAQLQEQLKVAEQQAKAALEAWQQVRSEHERLLGISRRLAEKQANSEQLHAQYQVLGTLADAVAGNNSQRLTLHRFVLSILLDDVLHEASARLAKMSGGRYELRRDTEVRNLVSAGGLNLIVDDAYTGRVRPVNTLSGGESFMAALALALGLSDVVQSYAGGIRLETLFIDEGFGSLDEHALDAAVAVLAELRAHGRTIGIISHVRELKERLPDRIDVLRQQHGSTTQLIKT